MTARFGLIRHLLYYWPTTSYAAISLSFFAFGVFLIVAKLGYQEYSARAKSLIERDRLQITKSKGEKKTEKNEMIPAKGATEEIKRDVKKEIPDASEVRKRK